MPLHFPIRDTNLQNKHLKNLSTQVTVPLNIWNKKLKDEELTLDNT